MVRDPLIIKLYALKSVFLKKRTLCTYVACNALLEEIVASGIEFGVVSHSACAKNMEKSTVCAFLNENTYRVIRCNLVILNKD